MDDRLAVVTRAHHQLQPAELGFGAAAVPRQAVELEKELGTRSGIGPCSVGSHEQHVPQATGLILIGLSLAVGVVPDYAVCPGNGRDGDWSAGAAFTAHRSCIDQGTVGQGLGAGLAGNNLPEKRVFTRLITHRRSPWDCDPGETPLPCREGAFPAGR